MMLRSLLCRTWPSALSTAAEVILNQARTVTTSIGTFAPYRSSTAYTGYSEVVIALGTNQGNRVENLLDGLSSLVQHGIEVLRVSLLYETTPMYVLEQAPFLNAAVLGRTDLSPLQLLYHLKQIEKAAGRDIVSGRRHGPRPLDLDIVFFGGHDVQHESLTVPHISWQDRSFVKAPVADLLLPDDLVRGHIRESHPEGSVMDRLLQAVQQWEAEGGEAQVGQPGLCRVLPIHRQIWELGHSTHICGILNVTPDSFSDGGKHILSANTTAATTATAAGVEGIPAEEQHQQQSATVGSSQTSAEQLQEAGQRQHTVLSSPAAAGTASRDDANSCSSSSSSSTSATPPDTAAACIDPAAAHEALPTQPATVTGGSSSVVDVCAAVESARAMSRAGAQLIDVGGQSTRPGSTRISVEEELARVLPVIRALRDDSELVHVPVSVDTFHARVAREAVAAGADMINDVTAGQHDPAMLSTVAALGVPYCLMHLRGELHTMTQPVNTTYSCVWREVGEALRQRAQQAVHAGVLPWNLVLDPGLGFSKTSECNAELLGNLQQMRREVLRGVWGRMPLLIGPSRKRFIGKLTGRHIPAERDLGSAAACVAAVAQGADIVRVHNVPMVAEALRVADGVFRGTWPILDD